MNSRCCTNERSLVSAALLALLALATAAPADRPNFLVITFEDISPRLGCYGDATARTPAIDRLASEGVRFTHMFATSPVCAPARCTLITGVYATSLGGMHMRSQLRRPPEVRCFTALLREAGYYCTNNGKTDYQFSVPPDAWDAMGRSAHWRNRLHDDQPFFAVFNVVTTHQGHTQNDAAYGRAGGKLAARLKADPAKVAVPPWLPDAPLVRRDIARAYDNITVADRFVAARLAELDRAGVADDTIVVFFSDHGDGGIPRCKQYVFDSGLRVPFIVRAGANIDAQGLAAPGSVDRRLTSFVDFAPTLLNLAGVAIPDAMQGRPFLGSKLPPERKFVYATRDRGNNRYDTMRVVRDRRFHYIRYYQPFKPLMQTIQGFEAGAIMRSWRAAHAAGTLSPVSAQFLASTKPAEALYDVQADPHQLHNLADDPAHQDVLMRMRAEHLAWVRRTGDLGYLPEGMLRALRQRVGSEWAVSRGEDDVYDAVDAARWASLGQLEPLRLDEVAAGLRGDDPPAQYWSALAVAFQLPAASARALADDLRTLSASSYGDVAAAAAMALIKTDLDRARGIEQMRRILQRRADYATLNALNLLDFVEPDVRQALMPEIEQLAQLEYRSIAQVERYVHDMAQLLVARAE